MVQNTAPGSDAQPRSSNVLRLSSACAQPRAERAASARASQFEGKLIFEGTVRIDGKFSGEIISTISSSIGEGAEVKPT